MALFFKVVEARFTNALHFSLEVGATALTVLMMGWISIEAQAAHAMVRSIISFGTTITWALSTAASILVGSQLGKRSVAMVRNIGFTGFMVTGLTSSIISLMLVVTRYPLLLLYGPEYSVLSIANLLISFVAVWNIFDSIYTVGMGILRGIEDTLLPCMLTTIIHWFIGLPVSYVFAFNLEWGAAGIWWGSIVSFALSAIALSVRFHLKTNRLAWG